ncbi:TIGR03086 family metal-binding protein [Streptomonospora wellingtoniae]|uniref:TIGR03086 family metal-binding protein n=1 Tax=Streptomonospora wellingtoniae TaxID=3075544 RepID=A0ABU2KRV6_9ACTN|nr:TIGR03086 family metal-binding protein [Streptomonospora sp. DSM 45055]MDT0302026.1 TIGR03086 family metal-binding protein [Streptomonospora sp. DSM 45055]
MSTIPDLEPVANRMREAAQGVRDDELDAPTPCERMPVGALLDHVITLCEAFRRAADKTSTTAETPPEPTPANLPGAWRDELDRRLDALVAAWRDPAAWQGATAVGGVELSGEAAGTVALNELLLHGWDLARATGQAYIGDPASVEIGHAFVSEVPADDPAAREGLFGPVVPVPEEAPLLDRVLGLSGRHPDWTPPPP